MGCGSGRFLERLQESGWEVEGVEPANVPAQRCRDRGLNVHLGHFESLKLDDESFDAVFAWMVIEHLHDPAAALREIHRLLKPDGTVAGGLLVFIDDAATVPDRDLALNNASTITLLTAISGG